MSVFGSSHEVGRQEFYGSIEVRLRLGDLADGHVRMPQRLPNRRLGEGLILEAAIDGAIAVEQRPHLDVGIASHLVRVLVGDVRLAEQVELQEIVDRFGNCGFPISALLLGNDIVEPLLGKLLRVDRAVALLLDLLAGDDLVVAGLDRFPLGTRRPHRERDADAGRKHQQQRECTRGA